MSSNALGMDGEMHNPTRDLPFLVTQYLSNFVDAPRNADLKGNEEAKIPHHEAIDRIRKATNDIAAAFADMGSFGVTLKTPIGESVSIQDDNNKNPAVLRNAIYSDLTRRWDSTSVNQLESLVSSSSAATSAVLNDATNEHVSILDLAYDREKLSTNTGASTTQQQQGTLTINNDRDFIVGSILQRPVLLQRTVEGAKDKIANNSILQSNNKDIISTPMKAQLELGSDFKMIESLAAQASKRYLSIREKFQEEKVILRQIQRSLAYQKQLQKELDDEAEILLATSCASVDVSAANELDEDRRAKSDELSQRKLENERVVAQLGRSFEEFQNNHGTVLTELNMANSVAKALWKQSITLEGQYLDPSGNAVGGFHKNCKLNGRKSDSILNHIIGRGYGIGLQGRKGVVSQKVGRYDVDKAIVQRTKKRFLDRVSHVVTINAHLYCPVFCLRFDRTGRYFVSGADDNLVKVFRVGITVNPESRERQRYHSVNPEFSSRRGAILVCTLRGHASVITDIDVSSDNALLATASEDGDVRIWGLTDGCPVAILRGHEGGANMVAWSAITPYQLATIAGDGLARVWDVREAALKRCKHVRTRRDYSVPLEEGLNENQITEVADDRILQSLPSPPQNNILEQPHRDREQGGAETEELYVPPLPVGAEFGIGADIIDADGNRNVVAGAFVANSDIDEGVYLLSRLQHGDMPENSQGAGTRSRRKKVKVICLSMCPIGGHFATGSDDGIGRIWLDHSNDTIEKLDSQFDDDVANNIALPQGQNIDLLQRTRSSKRGSSNAPSTSSLLASLHGHHNDITDVKYSKKGDRLITASQKDGVVRIWSWGTETSKGLDGSVKIDQIRQIFIRMEAPLHLQQQSSATAQRSVPTSRRRGCSGTSQKSDILTQCDVATWTADDSKVVTSQTCVVKAADTDIIPGSHILYIWDSKSGNCLIGLPAAHDKPCPVLFTHPFDSTILVSAGADGSVKIWDLDTGECTFSHLNLHSYGAIENLADRGKKCGYLDGSFSRDGLHLVLTDDSGRVTIIDVLGSKDFADTGVSQNIDNTRAPTWMQEQYFANDYYDLFYDVNGYCIERGSRRPPHLAPEAARCIHTGHACVDSIQASFSGLEGALPLCDDEVYTNRRSIRHNSTSVRKLGGVLTQNVVGKRHLIEARPKEIALFGSSRSVSSISRVNVAVLGNNALARRSPNRGGTRTENMSSNYRWIGYEEMVREDDDDDQESDDDEYQEGNTMNDTLDEEQEQDHLDVDDYQPRGSRHRRRNRNSSQRSRRQRIRSRSRRDVEEFEEVRRSEPTRASSRQTSRRNDSEYVDLSDVSDFEEMLSANTSPVGEYATDYTERGHMYKLPKGTTVNRKWLTRVNSVLGYTGWKTYCPQVGDKVIYIPRAHAEVLKAFPICESSSGAPWKSWPKSNPWSMVQCEVTNIRYRFPFSGYFGNKARAPIQSVVAVLTLDITGIPIQDRDRSIPWARPEFIPKPSTRSSSSTFDVTIFENGESDFVLPLELYKWKIQSLETAIEEQGIGSGIELTDFFVNSEAEDSKFDPFLCEVYTTIPDDEREIHFQGSGYNKVHIKYEGNDESFANTWDVTVRGTENRCPLPTCLTNEQTKAILGILDSLESDNHVKAIFSAPVDTRSFVDYDQMIEVPMDISVIRRRLEQRYYTNVYSVLADLKLIRDNCAKYNKMGSEITTEGQTLFNSFQMSFEVKLSAIGYEPSSREKSAELDNALRSITSKRRSSRLTGDSPSLIDTNHQPITLNRVESSSRRPRRDNQHDVRSSDGVDGQAISSRSLRANNRSSRLGQEAPRIRINVRRTLLQQEYISEEGSGNEGDENSENEDSASANLKVLVDGLEYDESSDGYTDDNQGEEKTSIGRPKRKAAIQYMSSGEVESPVRRSSRRSTRASKRTMSTDSNQDTKELTSTRQSTRQATRRLNIPVPDDESSQNKFQEKESIDRQTKTVKKKLSSNRSKSDDASFSASSEGEIVGRQTRPIRSHNRSQTLAVSRGARSLSRGRRGTENEVESLQETFSRRTTARSTHSRHFQANARQQEGASTFGGRPRRSTARSSSLENLPVSSPISPGAYRSSSRQRTSIANYHDLSETEILGDESDFQDASEEEPISVARRKRPRATAVRRPDSPKKKPKKRKRDVEVKLPQLDKWPGHMIKRDTMEEVCRQIIEKVELFDAEGLFRIPVVEQFPDVAEKYSEKISHPIDLRTILHERMPRYRVIGELQDDLILVFHNCCTFNRVNSQYWKYAVEIWENLNEIFVSVLTDFGIDPPRRFKR